MAAQTQSSRTITSSKTPAAKLSDSDGQRLLEQFLSGDEDAFDRIIQAYSPMMFGVFLRWFHLSVDEAQDLHQEVLLQLVKNAERIRNLRPWLLGASVNQSKKRIRKLIRDRKLGEMYAESFDQVVRATDRHAEDLVERGFQQLSVRDRELLRLMFIEGLSYKETADRLGHSIGSIGPLRGRAIDRFAEIVSDLEKPKKQSPTTH